MDPMKSYPKNMVLEPCFMESLIVVGMCAGGTGLAISSHSYMFI